MYLTIHFIETGLPITQVKKQTQKKPKTKNVHKQNLNSIADMFDEATQVVKSFT